LPRKALRRFKNLPVVPEVALVGVAALMLLVLLSPSPCSSPCWCSG
jgi:hypothetical protein